MQGIAELVGQVRDHYVQQFRGSIEVLREQCSGGHGEVKLELSDHSGLFRRLYCADFVAKEDGKAIVREMYPDKILVFDPLSFEVGGATVVVDRLVWDDVQVHHDADTLAGAGLDRWFDYWFDINDARLDPTSDIAGVVHSLSVNSGLLNIDLGTAAPEAFWDILDLLATAQAANIRITSGREPE